MQISVLRETALHEQRVALVPQTVQKLVSQGHKVVVERGAGERAFFPDDTYAAAGAELARDFRTALQGCDLLVGIQRSAPEALAVLQPGATVICLLQKAAAAAWLDAARERQLTVLAMELVPRTTKAQAIDVLSSQATVAGYLAVLLGASHIARLLPMLTTAAGTVPPGKVFVLGAGVAGLQAIATARRLGAVVSAFDVRPAVREEVESLGARFVEPGAVSAAAEGSGGYATELAGTEQERVLAAVGKHLPEMDLVITTAQIPGKPAPRLVTEDMVRTMRPGSAIVDLAVESGGNCALTRPGETVLVHGVTILGPRNLPAKIPQHASVMYSKNLQHLLEHLIKDGRLVIDPEDSIAGPMTVARGAAPPPA